MIALGAALRLAEAGCHVFPCLPGRKEPATAHGLKDATRDPDAIRGWWEKKPAANVAISCEPSRLGVVDLDGSEGIATWQGLIATQPTERTLTVRTPSGGAHLYYVDQGGRLRNSARRIGPGVDSRGVGGYVIAPPSQVGGRPYSWCESPDLTSLPVVPGWVLDALRPPERPPAPAVEPRRIANGAASSRYADKALESELQAVLEAAVGTRNATLNGAAYSIGQLVGAGLLDEPTAAHALALAATAAGLPFGEADRTIRSGLTAGVACPRRMVA